MNSRLVVLSCLTIVAILLHSARVLADDDLKTSENQQTTTTAATNSSAASFFERIRNTDWLHKNNSTSSTTQAPSVKDVDDENDDDFDDDDDLNDIDDDVDEDDEQDTLLNGPLSPADRKRSSSPTTALIKSGSVAEAGDGKIVTDMFGNRIKLEKDRTILLPQSKARDFGLGLLLTLKLLFLGPLIGLTIKGALIRGLLWAIGAYLLHLFFPALLSALGLGTGLVGFARQSQAPNFLAMLLPQLAHFPNTLSSALPMSLSRSMNQYMQMVQPLVEAIRSIPEGHCRFRAVCETANYLITHNQHLSSTLQRVSATVYLNFGTEYSKAWLDGIVQSDCAVKYAQCPSSPFEMLTSKLNESMIK